MLTPETILQGRYRIIRQLGQGGMGAVYEAIDQRLDTTVALKETLFSEERLRKQFEREARLLARLHHPALPRVSDHFSEADGQFLVMQFIPGDDLSEMMTRKRGPFPADQVLTWADQLLDALDYLHTQDPQIVHRDIKPQNLKLTSRGQIILLDFGLAKGQAGDISRVTTSASIFGYTPNYAPLEQIQGLGTDSRSDLYSLGATLYHLITGVKPPDALTRAAALVNGQSDPLQPASVANPTVARELDEVFGKAMAQNREQRYATAADMRRSLHESEQATTVVNRGEAQTVLFPPPPKTVGAPAAQSAAHATQAGTRHETIRTGETTVVRPVVGGGGRRVLPLALSAVALLVLACGVLAFFMLKKRDDHVVQATPTPSPVASPAALMPSPEPSPTEAPEADDEEEAAAENATPAPAPKKPERQRNVERASREDEANRDSRPRNPEDVDIQVHVETPEVPNPPDPQNITMRDGTRVYVSPEGQRRVIPARDRQNRRTPAPSPSP
jgi:hypothetical protein